jgi:hypothetical protein
MSRRVRDYKYGDLFRPDGRPDLVIDEERSIRSARLLLPTVDAFFKNLARAAVFALMPAKISSSVRRDQLLSACAELEVTGKLDPNYLRYASEQGPPGYAEAFHRLLKEQQARDKDSIAQIAKAQIGIRYVETVLDAGHLGIANSIEALFSSLVSESWTAFEILASDLWAIGVDHGPKEVAARISLSKQLQKQEDHVTPETVHKLEFDARTHLGSFLRETGRVSFQKLDYIRLYYAEAFGKEVRDIFDKTCGGYIFALSAFRNALIHNAGKADKAFEKKVTRFPEFRDIAPGTPLLLDGELVKKLTTAGAQVGIELISFVDDLLTPPRPDLANANALVP